MTTSKWSCGEGSKPWWQEGSSSSSSGGKTQATFQGFPGFGSPIYSQTTEFGPDYNAWGTGGRKKQGKLSL